MVGRGTEQDERHHLQQCQSPQHDHAHHHHHLALRTDFKGKAAAREHDAEPGHAGQHSLSPAASLNSLYADPDDHLPTHLSASSTANTDTLSSSDGSAKSTARTSTMTDEDRHSPTSPSSHAHPTLTLLELVSNTASSSALPDSFDFNVSRKGNFVAVYSSSNIWLVKTVQLPRLWARTLQVKRKPVAIDITEDGFLLAVLSRPSQVDVYEIHGEQDKQIVKRRTILLVHEAHSVVISPDSLILITGNKFGIEVVAIGPGAPDTARRTLSGPVGDTLEFSDDSRTLLITGYARKSGSSSLFVLPGLFDGPLNEEGIPMPEAPESIWTGSVLFPETARIAQQATLLPDPETSHVQELFAFNVDDGSWGIYDIGSQRFTQTRMFLPDQQRWTRSEFLDDAMPAVSPNTDLAAVALRVRGTTSIWIYQVPGSDFKSDPKPKEQSRIQPCFCIPIISDKSDTYQEICVLRWVKINSKVQRLVAVGNSSNDPETAEVPGEPVGSKGVIIVLDFDSSKPVGSPVSVPTKTEYDLDPLCPGEMLPEGAVDFEREVELVRTRTLAQRRAQDRTADSRRNSRGSAPGRARTSAIRNPNSTNNRPPTVVRDDEEELTAEEAQAAFEAPYDNQQPRSQMSLARAATVAAVSPANRRHLRALPFRPLEYRRADGLREFPHESDADNWVPPPPAYTATAEASQSVSLSHPQAPPAPSAPTRNRVAPTPDSSTPPVPPVPPAPTQPNCSIPPVPPLPSNIASSRLVPTNPYGQGSGAQSQSSTDLTATSPAPPQERRPSLLHPSTFPSPQSFPAPARRRSSRGSRGSNTQSPVPQVPQMPQIPTMQPQPPAPRMQPHDPPPPNPQLQMQMHPQHHPPPPSPRSQLQMHPQHHPTPLPQPQLQMHPQHHPPPHMQPRPQPRPHPYSSPQPHPALPAQPSPQSAYQATSSRYPSRQNPHASPSSRRAAETTLDLRPPPVLDPSSPTTTTITTSGSRRGSAPNTRHPLPAEYASNRLSMPMSQLHSPPPPQQHSSGGGSGRRGLLPKLTTPTDGAATSGRGGAPVSAPPRADGGFGAWERQHGRAGAGSRLEGGLGGGGGAGSAGAEKGAAGRKKSACLVM